MILLGWQNVLRYPIGDSSLKISKTRSLGPKGEVVSSRPIGHINFEKENTQRLQN